MDRWKLSGYRSELFLAIVLGGLAVFLRLRYFPGALPYFIADGKFEAELETRVGRGYCPAEGNKKEEQDIGIIPIDSLFSPVSRVKYDVDNCRVGRRTDYDKLIIEIWTDGRVTPDDALTLSAAILRHHLDIFVSYDKDLIEFEASEKQIDITAQLLANKSL